MGLLYAYLRLRSALRGWQHVVALGPRRALVLALLALPEAADALAGVALASGPRLDDDYDFKADFPESSGSSEDDEGGEGGAEEEGGEASSSGEDEDLPDA